MTYTLGIKTILHQSLFILILSSLLGTIEWTDALCGKPGRTPVCKHNGTKDEYEVEEKVTYNCTDCYSIDEKERRCLQNGSWSGHIPVCHKMLPLENVRKVSFFRRPKIKANSTMDRDIDTCSAKVLKSETFWEVVLTKSFNISVVEVVFPGQLQLDVEVKIKDGNRAEKTCGQYNGSTESGKRSLHFTCSVVLRGDLVRITQRVTPVSLCEVYLFTQPDNNSCLRPDRPLMAFGRKVISGERTIYSLECKDNYELIGINVVECRGDTWAASSAFCRRIHCHQLPSVNNGRLRVNTTSVHSTAFLKCQDGYTPVGEDKIYCLPTGEWNVNSLNCTAIKCDDNPRIRNGQGILLDQSSYLGSKLQVICDPGYIAIESKLRECHENATWGNLDICVEINCGPFLLGVSEGEQWMSLYGKTSIRVLICDNGYYIEGSPAVTQCLPNGSWSYTTAACKKFSTNDGWSTEWEPSTLFMSAVAVGAGTAICIVCLFLSFLIVKKRKQPKRNTAVFHVGVADSFLYTDGIIEQESCKNTYEDVIELRHNSFNENPRKPSIALPHLPIDADPVYAQPFEIAGVGRAATANMTDIYTAHIYSEPIDSHKTLGVNMYNNVAETWLKSGAKKFGRKMSLPGHSSLTEDSMLAASPNIAVCKPVFHSTNVNPINAIHENYEKTDFEIEKQDKLELISNSIYSGANEGSFSSCKDMDHLQMIDNDIYQGDYFSNV